MSEFPPQSIELVQRLTKSQNSIYSYILSLTLDRETAQDILQETNVLICEKAAEFRSDTDFLSWALAIARFKVLAHRRSVGRDKLTFGDTLFDRLVATEPRELDLEDRVLALGRCLDKLPRRQRALIDERYQSGVTMEVLAGRVGRTKQSLAVTLHRIRRVLLRCLENAEREGN